MSKTTTLLLAITLFAAVAVHSVNSAAADVVTFTNSSFYKEKSAEKLVSAGDGSLADNARNVRLIAGKNSKTNYYVYQTNIPTDSTVGKEKKGGVITVNYRKVDVNKLAFAEGSSAVSVTGFKWDPTENLQPGASVKNNVTLLGVLSLDPSAENIVQNLYAYFIDLDKNEKTELLIASGSYTDVSTKTTVSIQRVLVSGSLTIVLYSSTASTSTGNTATLTLATLKDGKLGASTTVKTITWTGNNPSESLQDIDVVGENVYIVIQSTANSLNTETVYLYTVSDKEIKAGTTAVLNTQVTDTNKYGFESIFGHSEGRWVAYYTNSSTDQTTQVVTTNHVVKASNDTTGFKVLLTDKTDDTGKTSKSYNVAKHFGGVVVYITEGTTSSGESSIDQYTYSYQIFSGDFTAGTKTPFAAASGKYKGSDVTPLRLGDNKAVNVLIDQISYDSTTQKSTTEGTYLGQLFQKSFGATLQSVLAVCSLMLAALFIF